MSRSNGQFPKYTRLNVDPDVWPESYYDKTRRCSECGLGWPHPHIFRASPCCDAPTKLQEGPPDMRWPDALKLLHEARFDHMYDEWNEGKSDEDLKRDELRTLADTINEEEVAQELDRFLSSEHAA